MSDLSSGLDIAYKKKRMMRKQDLVNRYKSLSLMADEDFSHILKKPKPEIKFREEDEISGIFDSKK